MSFFRRLRVIFVGLLMSFTVASCSYDDSDLWNSVNDLDNRVTQLEKLCAELNTNVQSIQVILNSIQENDFITAVTPIMENGTEAGYTISFAKHSPINIYHGKNGSNGANGADGYTPKIGVKEDVDGKFYWTLDGEWLTDENGKKMPAQGTDGVDGANGSNGSDGIDGVTPKLKIEDGYWYVSYDNGNVWTLLGKATGDNGNDGADGSDGDSMFDSVDYTTDGDYVIIVLSDGTTLQLPTWKAFVALKNMVEQLNVNLSSLQVIVDAIQKYDFIKAVTPITDNKNEPIGYTITFAHSAPITIYHGKNGSDGSDGKDGYTPQISVKKDSDGIYYWIIDGRWLTDEEGNKIKAQGIDGENGVDGADGESGANGSDGVTPKLKIEGGYWYISYDEGATWSMLGKATGENGSDGDSLFLGIDYQSNADFVTFTLADGSVIKLPTWKAFEELQLQISRTNTNLNALKTIVDALNNQDWITGVSAVSENGKIVGYSISFAKSNPIIIYNGADGSDGADGVDGKDGYVPNVSVKQDADGLYYWTVDGEWLLDGSGNKICAQGREGHDGHNGSDGVTPQLKIKEGYWYISYDNGLNWTQVGKATGDDGHDGADGKDGNSIKITQDENNVYFELSDGTVITISKSGTSGNRIDIEFPDEKNGKITVNQTNVMAGVYGTPYEITSGFISGETTITQEMVSYSSSYINSSNVVSAQEYMARHSVCGQTGTIAIWPLYRAIYKIKVTITNGDFTKITMLNVEVV